MKFIIILLAIIITRISLCAQTLQQIDFDSFDQDSCHAIPIDFTLVEPPTFRGDSEGFDKYVARKLKYPKEARKCHIEGTVVVEYIIDTLGNVKNIKVVKSAHPLLDQEVVNIVSASPKWNPAKNNSILVNAKKIIRIKFSNYPY
jgi:TonB family protein